MSPRRRERKSGAPESLWGILERAFGRRGLKKRIKENQVFTVWQAAVGEGIAANCSPVAVNDGVLTVEAKSSSWMQELSMLREDLMRELNREMGWDAIRDLRFRVADPKSPAAVKVSEEPVTERVVRPSVDKGTALEIDRYLEGIQDSELKEALRRFMERGYEAGRQES